MKITKKWLADRKKRMAERFSELCLMDFNSLDFEYHMLFPGVDPEDEPQHREGLLKAILLAELEEWIPENFLS